MKSLADVLKACDIRSVLISLCDGCYLGEAERRMKQYYSFFCKLLDWLPEKMPQEVLTDYRRASDISPDAACDFYSVSDPENPEERRIDWRAVYQGDTELLIPDCIDEAARECLVAEILYKVGAVCEAEPQECTNTRLFAHVACRITKDGTSMRVCRMILEHRLHFMLDRRILHNELRELAEKDHLYIGWGALWDMADDFSIKFYALDTANLPDYRRALKRWMLLRNNYGFLSLSDYNETSREGWKIIIEKNHTFKKLPLVYARDRFGNKKELRYIQPNHLLCMDIKILDPDMGDAKRLAAVLMFYLEYPLRVERILKEHMVQYLTGVLRRRS